MEGWVKVAEYTRNMDLDLAESMLRAAEIPCHRQGDQALSTVYPGLSMSPRTIWVPPDRVEEALGILSAEITSEETEK